MHPECVRVIQEKKTPTHTDHDCCYGKIVVHLNDFYKIDQT